MDTKCEITYLTTEKENRLWALKNMVLRRIFGPKGRKSQEAGENCIMRNFIICTLH
jgi:hypothetical protein